MLEKYVFCNGRQLRCGVTTGTCAAAAAKAAALRLLNCPAAEISVLTPAGVTVNLPVEMIGEACGVRKDAGDDPDVTDGMLICAHVELTKGEELLIAGGEGVGRVTKPGLEQPVGAAAINRVPRLMIAQAVREVLGEQGACVTVFVPGGAEIARRTANPRLGIVDGISILGTTGIVEPMSESALVASIQLELSARRASGADCVLVTPGNYGETFARERYGLQNGVLCSNFVGEAVDFAASAGFHSFLLMAHAGKLVKLAGGIYQTHSRIADARMEILAAHAAMAGAAPEAVRRIMECVTADGAFDLLEETCLLAPVLEGVMERIAFHLARRAGEMKTAAVMFTNGRGELGRTSGALEMIEKLRQ